MYQFINVLLHRPGSRPRRFLVPRVRLLAGSRARETVPGASSLHRCIALSSACIGRAYETPVCTARLGFFASRIDLIGAEATSLNTINQAASLDPLLLPLHRWEGSRRHRRRRRWSALSPPLPPSSVIYRCSPSRGITSRIYLALATRLLCEIHFLRLTLETYRGSLLFTHRLSMLDVYVYGYGYGHVCVCGLERRPG